VCATLAFSSVVMAQPYPNRPITLIVPYGAGGPLDTLTRIVSDRMRAPLGQSLVIENVTGASGSIGVGRAVRSVPDGYKEAVRKLTSAAMEALADPSVRSRLTELGQVIPPREKQTAEALGAFHKAEIERWWPIIKSANVSQDR
jgi:tripartite-type tricarboxylate transporter receptor subunit TctC